MSSGYMTLPVPVLGNTYAPWRDPTATESLYLYGVPEVRSTPSPYWAVLWNRCFAIIDQHDHTASGINVNSNKGKKLRWIDPFTYPSGQTPGAFIITSDLDMQPKPGFTVSQLDAETEPFFEKNIGILQNMRYFGFYLGANIVDETHTLVDRTFNNFGPSVFPLNSANPSERYVLYSRLRYSRVDFPGDPTLGVDNYAYAPRIDLVWNNGSADGKGTVLVLNEPAGDRAKWWKYAGTPNPNLSTTMTYHGTTNQPYQGIVDKGYYGGSGEDAQADSNGFCSVSPQFTNSAFMIRSINFPGYVSTIQFGDFLKTADPIEYYDQDTNILCYDPNDPAMQCLWTMFEKDSTGTYGPTAGRDQLGYRPGKMMWVTDFGGQATAGSPIQIDFREIQTAGAYKSGETLTIRWYQGGVAKSRSFVEANTPTGDVLQTPVAGASGPNYSSILLVKASRLEWFAYFVD